MDDEARNKAPLRDETWHRRVEARFDLGSRQHGPSGMWFRRIDGPRSEAMAFVRERPEHAQEHLRLLAAGDDSTDHAAAVAWFCCFLHAAEKRFGAPAHAMMDGEEQAVEPEKPFGPPGTPYPVPETSFDLPGEVRRAHNRLDRLAKRIREQGVELRKLTDRLESLERSLLPRERPLVGGAAKGGMPS